MELGKNVFPVAVRFPSQNLGRLNGEGIADSVGFWSVSIELVVMCFCRGAMEQRSSSGPLDS